MIEAHAAPNNQLRQHLGWGLPNRARVAWHRLRGARLGGNVWVDWSAQLLRYPARISIGSGAILKAGCHVCPCNKGATVSIGARTTIGFYTMIYASSRIEIGDDCMIAPFAYIVDSNHGIRRAERMNRQANTVAPVLIGADVWIGAHAVVLSGVSIAEGAIVAAGAVVREDVEPYTIVAGVPARRVGVRE